MIAAYLSLMRPKHWLKNVFVVVPIAFAGHFTNPVLLQAALLAFGAFCLAASSIYCFNDVYDLQADRNHPARSKRPIASGAISAAGAVVFAIILAAVVWSMSFSVNRHLAAAVRCYLHVNVYYTVRGKHMVIGDAFCIAIGFVLRVIGGAYAINVSPTGWIVITTFFLSLFLGFGKRRNEIAGHGNGEARTIARCSVSTTSPSRSDLVSTGTISIISYAIYTLDRSVIVKFGTDKLFYTVPFVAYGVFRYIHLLLKSKEGDPTEMVTSDTRSCSWELPGWRVSFCCGITGITIRIEPMLGEF